jgi:molybdopterin-guanine dinucleotide biosynthesis protein A
VELLVEPDEPRHPLAGVVHALDAAGGRPVLVVAVDLPLVTAGLLRELAARDAVGVPAVVAAAGGELQPLCARYAPEARAALASALPDGRVLDAVRALRPVLVDTDDPAVLANVNTPRDMARAEELLAGASRRSRSSCAPAARTRGRRRGA